MAPTMQSSDGGKTWTEAKPLGWLEEHDLVQRARLAIAGRGHCGKPALRERVRVSAGRNSRQSFLVGASWSHRPEWPHRLTHLYVGPYLISVRVQR